MNLEELVNDKYDLLTANDREILTTVFRDKQSVKEMNSTQLASFLHVSRTTIVRLMKKLGIDSYQEFKLLLNRKEEEHTVYAYDLQDIVKEYHMMVDELKKHETFAGYGKCLFSDAKGWNCYLQLAPYMYIIGK